MDPSMHGVPVQHMQAAMGMHPGMAGIAQHAGMAHAMHSLAPVGHDVDNDEKILADIAAEGRERYQNTLVGRLAEYMREMGGPVSLAQCTEALRDVYPELRKPDGTRYKGSLERAIHGALWSTGVFRKGEGDDELWYLKEEEANDYERKLTLRFQGRSKKRKDLSSTAKAVVAMHAKKQRRKHTRKSGKRGDIIRLLASFSQGHKDAADRAAAQGGGIVPPDLQAIFKNPFKGWTTADSEDKIRRRLGSELFMLMMQFYHSFEDVLIKALEPEEMGYDAGRPRGAGSAALTHLQKSTGDVLQRLGHLEMALGAKPEGADDVDGEGAEDPDHDPSADV